MAAPTAPTAQDTAAPRRRPLTPLGGFARSLLLPGWSQAILGRRLPAALFIGVEGLALGMAIKASRELHTLEAQESDRADGKRDERQDWLVLLGFNHLFAGLEAFVSSHLWDFPEDVRIEAAPRGMGVRVTLPVRFR